MGNKGNKRKQNKTKTDTGSKVQRGNDPPANDIRISSSVKLLSEARDSTENKSFSGLDFTLMEKLFKGSDVASVANILYDNSSPIDFKFELPALQSTHGDQSLKQQASSSQETIAANVINPNKVSLLSLNISQNNDPLPTNTLSSSTVKCVIEHNETNNLCAEVPLNQLPIEKTQTNTPTYSNKVKSLSPTSGLWRNYTENDIFDQNFEYLFFDENRESSASSSKGTIDNFDNEDLESVVSPRLICDISNNTLKTTKLLSPTTGLWTDIPENEDILNNSDQFLDDSVEDPNYEELRQHNSCTDSDGQEQSQDNNSDENNSTNSDNTCSGSENGTEKTRKKRKDPSTWKRNVAKFLRNSGKKYTTLKKGIPIPDRKMGSPCNDICRLKCSTKVTEDERKCYFDRYWSLNNINKQRQYISNLMRQIKPKYRYPKDNRKFNHAFYLPKNDTKIKVCKKFFTSTLGITNRCIRTVIDKTRNGLVEEDRRGKHNKHGELPEEVKNIARAHICSIPVIESHYRRADSSRNYIEGGRNLTDLFKDYKKQCIENNQQFVSFSSYRNFFYYEFNLSFFKPKKDMCQFCESYKNSNEADKAEKEEEYKDHHHEKNLSRLEKAEDKKKINSYNRVACFDLEAALPTPRGEISTFYYRSKLSTYNFTICDLNTKGLGIVHCYVWHEGEGHKGSNEIGSALLHYLELCSKPPETTESAPNSQMVKFTLYSDNCGGQGKNKFIIAAYLYAVANFNIDSIIHKFLVVGHTQNEGDVSHSLVERNIKKTLKSGPIYVPSQYSTIISTAKKTGEPFKVNEIDHEFFYDLKALVDDTSTNFNVNDEGEKFNFNDICTIKVEKSSPSVYYYKTSYKDTEFKAVNVTRSRTRKRFTLFKDVQLKKAYNDSIPISRKKYQDLQYLINSNTIPRSHATFFTNLKHE